MQGRGEACLALPSPTGNPRAGEREDAAMRHDRISLRVLPALRGGSKRDPARSQPRTLFMFHVFMFHGFHARRGTSLGPALDPVGTGFGRGFSSQSCPAPCATPAPTTPSAKPRPACSFFCGAPITASPTASPASNASIRNSFKGRFRAKPPLIPPLTPQHLRPTVARALPRLNAFPLGYETNPNLPHQPTDRYNADPLVGN